MKVVSRVLLVVAVVGALIGSTLLDRSAESNMTTTAATSVRRASVMPPDRW